ncbi:hypothetical protein BJ912DRAFT_1100202 [Pholiota molesta]|nr:hypothetical protein BJ912DRAFT_1100202 [Pholiota molesta]
MPAQRRIRCPCLDLLSPPRPRRKPASLDSPRRAWPLRPHFTDECVPTSEPEEVEVHWPLRTHRQQPYPPTAPSRRHSEPTDMMDVDADSEADSIGSLVDAEMAELRARFPEFVAWEQRIKAMASTPTPSPTHAYPSDNAHHFTSPSTRPHSSCRHTLSVASITESEAEDGIPASPHPRNNIPDTITSIESRSLAVPPPSAALVSVTESETESATESEADSEDTSPPLALPPLAPPLGVDESVTESETESETEEESQSLGTQWPTPPPAYTPPPRYSFT